MKFLTEKNEGDKRILYISCPSCRTFNSAKKYKGKTCPVCGETIPATKKESLLEAGFEYLSPGSWNYIYSKEAVSEKGDKVVYTKYDNFVFPNIKGRYALMELSDSYVFNTRTGQTTKLPILNTRTGKKVGHLENVSYGSLDCLDEKALQYTVSREAMKELLEKIAQKKGVNPPKTVLSGSFPTAFNKWGDESLAAAYALSFKYGHCHKAIRGSKNPFANEVDHGNVADKYLLRVVSKNDAARAQKWIRAQFEEIPSKSILKILYRNPFLINLYVDLAKILSDTNVIRNILLEAEGDSKQMEQVSRLSVYGVDQNTIKEMAKRRGEPMIAKAILSDTSLFNDVIRQFHMLERYLSKHGAQLSQEQEETLFKGNIKEIHDRLIGLTTRMSDDSFYIPYEKKELALNKRVGEMSFVLAKTEDELKIVGNEMRICVGSYGRSAVSKRCSIVVGYKDNEPKVCMELNGKEIRQIKAFANSEATAYSDVLKRYVADMGLVMTSYSGVDKAPLLSPTKAYSGEVEKLFSDGYYVVDDAKNAAPRMVDKGEIKLAGKPILRKIITDAEGRRYMLIPDNNWNEPLPF